MKFGLYLDVNKDPEWAEYYIDYHALKKIIGDLEHAHIMSPGPNPQRVLSLSVPAPTNAAVQPHANGDKTELNQEVFFNRIEQEMKKVSKFTTKKAKEIREGLDECASQVYNIDLTFDEREDIIEKISLLGKEFIRLEKYVNLNFTGFHKILKKHDKRLPNACKSFYIARLHEQGWVKGDYSGMIVTMSQMLSYLRGEDDEDDDVDEEDEEEKGEGGGGEEERQDFIRTTTKYWVATEDVSEVKCIVMQHLPVLLQQTMEGTSDSQLVNSIYLDNAQLELYHGRLDKTPGAIALRLRWYGTGTPEIVFVERKTHKEGWTGDISVKERFSLENEEMVREIFNGGYNVHKEMDSMKKRGVPQDVVSSWSVLVQEVMSVINSKQLSPCLRTQYMRTAFQRAHDASVRVSIDTNLCMINERGNEAAGRWYRDPDVDVPKEEIVRFPHAVVEVKLQLQDEGDTPDWVTDLITSGMMIEVHKFSKFIHGCSVLLPEEVQTVPYWVDDPTLVDSIIDAGGKQLLEDKEAINKAKGYSHFLPSNSAMRYRMLQSSRQEEIKDDNHKLKALTKDNSLLRKSLEDLMFKEDTDVDFLEDVLCCISQEDATDANLPMSHQKIEPKLFFAAERTFIHWMHMSVVISSLSSGIMAFSNRDSTAQYYGFILLPIALGFNIYALRTFLWRSRKIKLRTPHRWDDPYGPVILTFSFIIAILVFFFLLVKVEA